MKYRIKDETAGSVSIEAAVIMPAFLGVLLVFISLLKIIAAQNILDMSVVMTADKLCKWAPIYKNLVADNIQDGLIGKAGETIGTNFGEALSNELEDFIMGILNLRKVGELSFNYIYGFTSQELCEKHIRNNKLVKNSIVNVKNLNLYKSIFFPNDSNSIFLEADCEVETYLPFPVKITSKVDCAAWGSGIMPHISVDDKVSTEENSPDSIWKQDNFTRGRVIRQIFGANLPETFPVIALFENGTATMIKSLNHKATTYQNSSAFEKIITDMINGVASFQGGTAGNITVKKEDILMRRLILVMPEDNLSVLQEGALKKVMFYATSKLVVLDLQRYQKV